MFPYRDSLTQGYRFPVVWALLVVLLGITAADLWPSRHVSLIPQMGFTPLLFSQAPARNAYTLVTASFLHADIFHVAGNCLFLWVFGRSLERLFGWKVFAASFPVIGIMGFVAHWLCYPASPIPVVGASGSIAALLGAYLALFPRARMRVAIVYFPFWKRISMPAWTFLGYWIGLQSFSMLLGSGVADGVAYAVHIGAFALGLIAAAIWKTSYPAAEEDLQAFLKLGGASQLDV